MGGCREASEEVLKKGGVARAVINGSESQTGSSVRVKLVSGIWALLNTNG